MIFVPSTNIKLLTGVPLENNYSHTLSFDNEIEQQTYFLSKTAFSFSNCSYQRYDPSQGPITRIRVGEVADRLYNVNYLMFQNNNFSNKWFYAFVLAVHYINDGMSEIIYQIDVMQTWYFQIKIQPSFVVREHVNNDAKYANLIEENLETGEYVLGPETVLDGFTPMMVPAGSKNHYMVIMTSFSEADLPTEPSGILYWTQGGILGYQQNNITYWAFQDSLDFIKMVKLWTDSALSEGILGGFMLPKAMWPDKDTFGPWIQTVDNKGLQQNTIDGYVPKNNKLFNYPFSFLYVTNCNGGTMSLRYELFTGKIAFGVGGCLSPNPDMVLVPLNYKLANNGLGWNWNEALPISGMPMMSIFTDTFKAYLAQNASTIQNEKTMLQVDTAQGISNGILGVVNGIVQGAKGNIMGGISSVVNSGFNTAKTILNVDQYYAKMEDHDRLPPQGTIHAGNESGFALNMRNFHFYNMTITAEYAKSIDNYFSMYGYLIKQIKVPNTRGRKNWNYVQTENVQIIGNIPADDLTLICSIFNSGVTFWHTKDVGNYSLDNPIV